MKHKPLIIVIASSILMLVGFFAAIKIYQKSQSAQLEKIIFEDFKVFVPEHAVRKGNPDAKVFVVEFFDPECESCREFHFHMLSVMSDYEDKIQVVMRYAPFHQNSIFAIKILEAARMQDQYWQVLDLLFAHQPEWGSHHHPRPELIWNYLTRLDLDVEKLKLDMEGPSVQFIISQDMNDVRSLGVRATPTFFVNGKRVEEFGPDYLRAAIDEAIKASLN